MQQVIIDNFVQAPPHLWQKYQDNFRNTDYSKYKPKKYYEPINVEKEIVKSQEEQRLQDSLKQYPYYEELPRQSFSQMHPAKQETKVEQYMYASLFISYFIAKPISDIIYGRLITIQKRFRVRVVLGIALPTFTYFITRTSLDYQPQNLGVLMPLHYDEAVHNHYDLQMDAFRDVEYIKRKDQRIERKDYEALLELQKQKRIEIKNKQLYNLV